MSEELNEQLLMHAAFHGHTDIVNQLIEDGADVNFKNKYGNTALIDAAFHDHTEIVNKLINAGADVNAKNNYGSTALMLAVFGGYTETVKTLINAGADITLKDSKGETALDIAIERDRHEIADLIQRHTAYLKAQFEAESNALLTEIAGLQASIAEKEAQLESQSVSRGRAL